ncbi:MAG TPA: TolC family protein [Allosphingosinicella sp.]|nr:TolC family protein [Allosphingosinicella sp.]
MNVILRLRRGIVLLGSLALAAAAAPAFAQQALSLDRAIGLAAERSPAATARTLERESILETAAVERAQPDPILRLGFENVPVDLGRDSMTMKTVGVSQEFVPGETRRARAAAAAARAGVADAERESLLADRRTEAARAWFDLRFDMRIHDYLLDLRREAALDVDAARAAYRSLAGSQADVVEAEAALAAVDDRIAAHEGDIAIARARLARWTGISGADVGGPFPNLDASPVPEAQAEAIAGRLPAVGVADARRRQAEAELRSAESERRRRYTVEAWYGQRDRYADMVGVTVSIPLQVNRRNRQDRTIEARSLGVAQADAEREESVRDQELRLQQLLIGWRTGRERVARYSRTLAPLADSRVEAALAAYRGGTGTLAQVIAARRGRFDVLLEALSVEAESARAWAELYTLRWSAAPAGEERPQ